jgi:hypothetical protein
VIAGAALLLLDLDAILDTPLGYSQSNGTIALREELARAYPGASVRDVRSAIALRSELASFARSAADLSPQDFDAEFDRLLIRTENMLGTFGPLPG